VRVGFDDDVGDLNLEVGLVVGLVIRLVGGLVGDVGDNVGALEIDNVGDLEKYGYGFFNVKKDTA
jgi:hypothetical protein